MMYQIDFGILLKNLNFICTGVKATVFICLLSSMFAFILGSAIAFLRLRKNFLIKKSAGVFVEFIRNTPLLIQLYIVYKGLPQLSVCGHSLMFDPVWCGIIALSIYTGVYISEVIRAGIKTIAREQKYAARSLGFNEVQIFFYIIYPQALRNVIPPLGSQFINLIKNSTLVSFISVTDIFYVMYQGIAENFRLYEYMLLGVALYCLLTGVVAVLTHVFEKHFNLKMSGVRV